MSIHIINQETQEQITFNSNNESIQLEIKVNLLSNKDEYRYIGDFLYFFKNNDGGNTLSIPSHHFNTIKNL